MTLFKRSLIHNNFYDAVEVSTLMFKNLWRQIHWIASLGFPDLLNEIKQWKQNKFSQYIWNRFHEQKVQFRATHFRLFVIKCKIHKKNYDFNPALS